MGRNVLTPDPLRSDRQWEQFYHFDIPGLEDTELTDELYALRPLLWGLPSDHWLRERVTALEVEVSKRQKDTRIEFSKKPKQASGVRL